MFQVLTYCMTVNFRHIRNSSVIEDIRYFVFMSQWRHTSECLRDTFGNIWSRFENKLQKLSQQLLCIIYTQAIMSFDTKLGIKMKKIPKTYP